MKTVNITLWFSILISLLVVTLYFIQKDYVFSVVLLTFSFVFLFGFREFGKPSVSYKIAHLYVGSILFTIAAGYTLLDFIFSFINVLLGEHVKSPTYADVLLWGLGLYSLFNIYRLRKFALKPAKFGRR
ncbi:MAG: hypothetical protein ABDH59_07550 [Fervidobacterium sp.]